MAAMQWFVVKAGQQTGPVQSTVLKQWAASGAISPTDLVWKEGMTEWRPAAHIKGLFPAVVPTSGAGAAYPAPPPLPPPPLGPTKAPRRQRSPAVPAGPSSKGERIRRIAIAQKMLLWAVWAELVLCSMAFVNPVAFVVLYVVIVPFLIYAVLGLGRACQWPLRKTVWVLVFLPIPYVDIIALYFMNRTAIRALEDAGLRVRFMWVRLSDLPED